MENIATITTIKYLDLHDPEFPKFVFCIPPNHTSLRWQYEEQLEMIGYYLLNDHGETVRPKFRPMIVDVGYKEAIGFDTQFALCYKMKAWRYFSFRLNYTESSIWHPSRGSVPFLQVYFSFSNNSNDRFLQPQQYLVLTAENVFGGCTDFVIHRLQQNEFMYQSCYAPYDEPKIYHQAFCMDLCVQREVLQHSLVNQTFAR